MAVSKSSGWFFLAAAAMAVPLFFFTNASRTTTSASTAEVKKPAACDGQYEYTPFSEVKGVRTRWETIHEIEEDRGKRASIHPNLGGLYIGAWAKSLTDQGANMGELNIDPAAQIGKEPLLAQEDLSRYLDIIYKPPRRRSPEERTFVNSVRDKFREGQYSVEQRDEILLDFLTRLEILRKRADGSVIAHPRNPKSPKLQFLVHQRHWFREDNGPAEMNREIRSFVEDYSGFINKAKARCLDHWIAGVRLGEHSNANWQQFLPVLVKIATDLNTSTDNWLKGRLFLVNGGGHGVEFEGIQQVKDPVDMVTPYKFFPLIAEQTKGFGIGYKWMKFREEGGPKYIGQWMEQMVCSNGVGRDGACGSRADWIYFLDRLMGFKALQTFINRSNYPDHANVLFVGDSSDSIILMSHRDRTTGEYVDENSLKAIRYLFRRASRNDAVADRWWGKLFMLHSNTPEGDDNSKDAGFAMFKGELENWGTTPLVQPSASSRWKRWDKKGDGAK